MNKDHDNEEKTSADDRKTLPFDRARDMKKPYDAPTLVKLGNIEKLTNVSIIVN